MRMTAVLEDSTAASGDEALDRAPNPRRGASLWLFAILFGFYMVVGCVLILRYNIVEGDGISRVANAGYALWSKDPHLSAMGFVWGPLPSLVELPVLQLSGWWPELRTRGLAGVVQSAAFTAGCAVLIRLIAIDRAVSVGWQWVAVACFALNPMIIIYAGTGMSESAMLFCILWTVRYLLRWLDSPRVFDLASVGLALAVGYLVRYETLIAAAGIAALVAGTVFLRSPRVERFSAVALSTLIVLFPIGAAFVLFAAAGWIMTGEAFAIISSDYGNSNQVLVAAERGYNNVSTDGALLAHRLFSMQPFVGIALILAATRAVFIRRIDPLVPIGAFGAVLAFAAWGQLTGSTFGWFRYFMAAIPLVIVIALVFWTPTDRSSDRGRTDIRWGRLGAALLGASLLIGIPVTATSLRDPDISNATVLVGVASVVDPGRYPPEDRLDRRIGMVDRSVAAYLDAKALPRGSVLMDTFQTWYLWLGSENPTQFVITSDYDFVSALNRPWESGIRHIVLTNPDTNIAMDAITRRYPTLWADGAGMGELVFAAPGPDGQERYRIYRLVEPPEEDDE
jgi:hypothetical protein